MLQQADLRKAAIVLASLDVDAAIDICRHMPDVEAEQLIRYMADLGAVDPDEQRQALEDFHDYLARPGGLRPAEHAERLMAEVLGQQSLSDEDERRRAAVRRLRGLNSAEPASIRRMLSEEMPQTVAVVISQLTPEKAAQVLNQWPAEIRSDLALRVAKMERLAPGAIEAIGEVLGRQAYRAEEAGRGDRGLEFVVRLLEDMDRSASKRLLTELRERDAQLADEVEDRLFTFENVVQLADADLQVLLRGLEHKTIARALKGVDESVRERIFANLSERGREILTQEIEFLGPVLVREVEAAQKAFVHLALELEQAGEITLTTDEAQYIE
ncbi:MAG: FliG C-terminal domain-containing protein [Armatimonadota bacterium]|nr:FliG C-terminal domain-containing protein [Armatimonadota bacterium]